MIIILKIKGENMNISLPPPHIHINFQHLNQEEMECLTVIIFKILYQHKRDHT